MEIRDDIRAKVSLACQKSKEALSPVIQESAGDIPLYESAMIYAEITKCLKRLQELQERMDRMIRGCDEFVEAEVRDYNPPSRIR